MSLNITTGVDQLLNLVTESNIISVKEAANKLDSTTTLIEAWAGFLEEQDKIEIKYKFSGIFLSLKNVKNHNSKISVIERENLSKKTDSLRIFILKLQESIETLEDSFKKVDGGKVSKQLKLIQELNNEKHEQEKELINEHLSTLSELEKVNLSLNLKKEKIAHTFFDVKEQLLSEQRLLSLEKKQLSLLRSNQRLVQRRLSTLKTIVSKKTKKLSKYNGDSVEIAKQKIKEISNHINILKKLVKDDSNSFKIILRTSKARRTNIKKIKKRIMKEIRNSMKNLKKDTWKEMKQLIDKKDSVQNILINLHREEVRIRRQLEHSKQTDNSPDVDQIEYLENKLKKITLGKDKIEKRVRKIHEKKTNKKTTKKINKKNSKKTNKK